MDTEYARSLVWIDYYSGSDGPTIRIDIQHRVHLLSLVKAMNRLRLGQIEECSFDDLFPVFYTGMPDMCMQLGNAKSCFDKSIYCVEDDNGIRFIWSTNKDGWWQNAGLAAGLLKADIQKGGHQYFNTDDYDDAHIEIAFCEPRNLDWLNQLLKTNELIIRAQDKDYMSRLEKAIESQDASLLEEVCEELNMLLLDYSAFPDEVFNNLASIITQPPFLEMQGSWVLLRIFEREAEMMSDEQRKRIASIFETIFPKFSDWMGSFLISEILSEIANNEQALAIWQNLTNTTYTQARAYIPHGLEHLAKSTTEPAITRQALTLLQQLCNDSCEVVQNEAKSSIKRLAITRIMLQ